MLGPTVTPPADQKAENALAALRAFLTTPLDELLRDPTEEGAEARALALVDEVVATVPAYAAIRDRPWLRFSTLGDSSCNLVTAAAEGRGVKRFLRYGALGVIACVFLGAWTSSAAGPITGKVKGKFNRNCLLCDGRLKSYIRTSSVFCGWQDGKVVVHVTMKNTAVEHVTVNWHPSYIIARGGEHGAGLGSIESSGFDAGELRQLFAKEEPKGVPVRSRIAKCKPSFSTIESG